MIRATGTQITPTALVTATAPMLHVDPPDPSGAAIINQDRGLHTLRAVFDTVRQASLDANRIAEDSPGFAATAGDVLALAAREIPLDRGTEEW